jgi:hypothetical protein
MRRMVAARLGRHESAAWKASSARARLERRALVGAPGPRGRGRGLLVQVSFGLSLPQGAGYVLGGGERPSALRLTGLAEPLPVGSL